MIFYFTGTGNSLQVAKGMAKRLGDRLICIPDALDREEYAYEVRPDEAVGFVFPVYAWAPPKIVMDFAQKLAWKEKPAYVYAICTCGDEAGKTMDIFGRCLRKKGLDLDGAFSLSMPNNYILMFDVDAPEVERQKLEQVEGKLDGFQRQVQGRQRTWQVAEGSLAGLKSRVVQPLFLKFATSTKPFHAEDTCIRCGKCASICPVHTIRQQKEGEELSKPSWGKKCTMCLACLHRCPVKAIQYGSKTQNKGRYCNPYVSDEI